MEPKIPNKFSIKIITSEEYKNITEKEIKESLKNNLFDEIFEDFDLYITLRYNSIN